MPNRRRTLLALAGAPLAARVLATPALAAGFPDRPVRLVVPYAPGGNADVSTRVFAPRMAEKLGQPVVVENRAGAGGSVAALQVARSTRPDGYTIMLGSNGPLTVNPTLQRNLGYDPIADFAPIGMVLRTPTCVVVQKDVPARSLAELIALGRARPGTITTGSSGVGSNSHLAIEAFNNMTGAGLQHVPYSSGGAMAPDLISGNIKASFVEISTALPMARAGQIRILALGTGQRMALAPDVPTFAESGVADFRPAAFLCLVLPANPPAEVAAALQAALAESLGDAAVRRRLEEMGSEVASGQEVTPAGLAGFLREELARTQATAERAGLRQG